MRISKFSFRLFFMQYGFQIYGSKKNTIQNLRKKQSNIEFFKLDEKPPYTSVYSILFVFLSVIPFASFTKKMLLTDLQKCFPLCTLTFKFPYIKTFLYNYCSAGVA